MKFKNHYALNTRTGLFHKLVFGNSAQEVGISFDPRDITDAVPERAVDAGKFLIQKNGVKIIGAFIIQAKAIILLAAFLSMVNCAKKSVDEPAEIPSCAHDVSAVMLTYADGVSRKSELTTCTYVSGKVCKYATWVNDPSVTFSECK